MEPSTIKDDTPTDDELRKVVRGMSNGRSGSTSRIRAEHLKEWLRGIVAEEKQADEQATTHQGIGDSGSGDNWRLFVKLIQTIWDTGDVPQQMLWMIVVLIPKGGETIGESAYWSSSGR